MNRKKIKQTRLDLNYSQQKLAQLTGIPQYRISRIERGVAEKLTGDEILNLSDALGIPLHEVLA